MKHEKHEFQPKPGDRMGCIAFIKDGVLAFLGYGTFEGFERPPYVKTPTKEELLGSPMAKLFLSSFSKEFLEQRAEEFLRDIEPKIGVHPKVRLDNGTIGWVNEDCHAGCEECVKELIGEALDRGLRIVKYRVLRNENGKATEHVPIQ